MSYFKEITFPFLVVYIAWKIKIKQGHCMYFSHLCKRTLKLYNMGQRLCSLLAPTSLKIFTEKYTAGINAFCIILLSVFLLRKVEVSLAPKRELCAMEPFYRSPQRPSRAFCDALTGISLYKTS